MKFAADDRQLLSLIAHELRSPSAVVAGYMRLLRKEDICEIPERALRMIEEADRSCARLLHLVRELADLAELAVSEPSAAGARVGVPVFSLCESVVQAAAAADDVSATFSCAAEDRPALVAGDVTQLKRAFSTLVAAMLRERGGRPMEIFGFVSRDDGASQAVIALGDSGISQQRDDVLTSREVPFDWGRGGMGLSVPIACRIVDVSGGHIWGLPQDLRAACALSFPLNAS